MSDLYQLRYRGAGAIPTQRQLETWGRRWVRTGKNPPGVRIDLLDWRNPRRRPAEVRRILHAQGRVFFGCPGIVAAYWESSMTMCDYDTPQAPPAGRWFELSRLLGLPLMFLEYRKTRRGWHVMAGWPRAFKPAEAIAMQLLLGSDPRREGFNLARVMGPDGGRNPRWNLLFSRKVDQ